MDHYIQLTYFFGAKGMQNEYIETSVPFLTLYGFSQLAESLGHNYAAAGYTKAINELRAEVEKLQQRGTISVFGWLSTTYGFIGDKENALKWLQAAVQEGDGRVVFLSVQQWDAMRSDPRFMDLVRRVGSADSTS